MKCLCVHSSSIIQRSGHKKSALSIAVAFHKNSLIVAWYTFTSIKIRTKQIRKSNYDKFKLLATSAVTNKGILNEKLLLAIAAVLTWNYLNTFILIAILGEYFR